MNTQKVDSKKIERAGGAGGAILAFILVFGFLASQGCASRTGWQFQIGIAPVTAIDNTTKLNQDGEKEQN